MIEKLQVLNVMIVERETVICHHVNLLLKNESEVVASIEIMDVGIVE